jgi:hypothetical protein
VVHSARRFQDGRGAGTESYPYGDFCRSAGLFLIWNNFAPDHHITAADSLAWRVVALVASMVLAQSANRIGLSIIGYVVAGAGGQLLEHYS